jgi:exodeoxyribonuclease V beta subunit
MKGFIDLVFRWEGRFYLGNWKSNHLGDEPPDYGPEALSAAMEEHFYVLQYHLCAVALDRYPGPSHS